jgi:hypothetical protein
MIEFFEQVSQLDVLQAEAMADSIVKCFDALIVTLNSIQHSTWEDQSSSNDIWWTK